QVAVLLPAHPGAPRSPRQHHVERRPVFPAEDAPRRHPHALDHGRQFGALGEDPVRAAQAHAAPMAAGAAAAGAEIAALDPQRVLGLDHLDGRIHHVAHVHPDRVRAVPPVARPFPAAVHLVQNERASVGAPATRIVTATRSGAASTPSSSSQSSPRYSPSGSRAISWRIIRSDSSRNRAKQPRTRSAPNRSQVSLRRAPATALAAYWARMSPSRSSRPRTLLRTTS